jgi:hypothetical protein
MDLLRRHRRRPKRPHHRVRTARGSLAETTFHERLLSCIGELLETVQESVPHLAKLQTKFRTAEALAPVDEAFLRNVWTKST